MSDLWTLTLYVAGRQQPLQMVYPGEGAARAALEAIRKSSVQEEFPCSSLEDGYGTEVVIFGGGPLEAVVLQDCGRASGGAIELGLLNARNQARAQERAGKDPVLKAAQQRQTLVQAQPMPLMPGKM